MTDDLSHLDATGQAELVRSGEATPRELVDAAIERIERVNPELVAPFGREDLLLRIAAQLEAALPWADRRPPVHA